jgi:hypothetical protein
MESPEPSFSLRGPRSGPPPRPHNTREKKPSQTIKKHPTWPPQVELRLAEGRLVALDNWPVGFDRLEDGDVLLLARDEDRNPSYMLSGGEEWQWRHAAMVFRDESGSLLVFDASPASETLRVRPARALVDENHWNVAGIARWHSRPSESFCLALRRLARARAARGEKIGGYDTTAADAPGIPHARVIFRLFSDARYLANGTLPTRAQLEWDRASRERIVSFRDVHIGTTFLEVANTIARLAT